MTTKVTWPDVVQVVRGLQNRQEGPPVQGGFAIRTDDDLRALNACLSEPRDTHCTLTNDESLGTLAIGQTVELSISPRLGFGLLKHDIAHLLADTRKARIREPSFFLMVD